MLEGFYGSESIQVLPPGLTIWSLLVGVCRHGVFRILEKFYRDPQMKKYKKKYKLFIQYLYKNYLSPVAKFPHSRWNNYYSILIDNDPGISTNALENVNLKLKKLVGSGFLSQKMPIERLRCFMKIKSHCTLNVWCVIK